MSGAVRSRTPQLNLGLLRFNFPNWGDDMNNNMRVLDAAISAIGISGIRGVWQNNTSYQSGDRLVDAETNSIWEAKETHVSAATGTFIDARIADPTLWTAVSSTVTNRGQWTTETPYKPNDFIQDGYRFGVAVFAFESGISYDEDVSDGNILTLIDFTDFANSFTELEADAESYRDETLALRNATEAFRNDASAFSTSAGTSAAEAKSARDVVVNLYDNLEGGTSGQVLAKLSNDDFNFDWIDLVGGGDMLRVIYDPDNVAGNAFLFENMRDKLKNTNFEGVYDLAGLRLFTASNSSPLLVERTGSNLNINMQFKGSSFSVFAGMSNGAYVVGNSTDLTVIANQFFQASLSSFVVRNNLIVGGSVDAGRSAVVGVLDHSFGYMYHRPYNPDTHGNGWARSYYDARTRTMYWGVSGEGTGGLTMANVDITGNAGSADTAGTATNLVRSIVAGNGMSGGGQLIANRTITLGTPGSISNQTTNSVGAATHTHALGFTAAEVYLGSSSGNTDYPVGTDLTVVLDSGTLPARNASVRFGTNSDGHSFINSGSNIVGTWRARGTGGGGLGGNWYKAQRTA